MTSHVTASPSVFWFLRGNRVALVGVARASFRLHSACDRWISPVPSGSTSTCIGCSFTVSRVPMACIRGARIGGGQQVAHGFTITL